MHPLQAAIIWILCVALGGVISIGIVLWLHRDPPRHAAPPTPRSEDGAAILRRWREAVARVPSSEWARRRRIGLGWPPERRADDLADVGGIWHGPDAPDPPAASTELSEMTAQVAARQAIGRWYAEREEALTQQLLDAGAAAWH